MDEYLLVLNVGSSSLKFRAYEHPLEGDWRAAVDGRIEGIGDAARFKAQDRVGRTLEARDLPNVRDAAGALRTLLGWLEVVFAGPKIVAVGHRVVHGGERYAEPVRVTRTVLDALQSLTPLAPLHQPHNLAPIETLLERMPGVPQVACFDTAFHRGHSAVANLVPLPKRIRDAGVQRYGFHGLSYEYIAQALPQAAPAVARGRVIVAHLGNGASLCALKDGKSVDCTFGFTALDGLCMGTRPGGVDPGVILHLFQTLKLSPEEVETMLYEQSGLLGISAVSNDMRELVASRGKDAKLAIDYFVYRAAQEIGAFAAVLGGVDALVFTAGIGENSAEIRRRICEASTWLGIELDAEANERHGPRITTDRARVSAWVVPTDEELMIARHTARLLNI
jgi:acetate kinase